MVAGGFPERQAVLTFACCNIEELMSHYEKADARIFQHAINAVQISHERVMIVSPDTDALVLFCHFISNLCSEVWMQMKTANQHMFLPILKIKLDMNTRTNLLAFHAVTGCDTIGRFSGIGKKTAWKVFLYKSKLLDNLDVGQYSEQLLQDCEEFAYFFHAFSTPIKSINKLRYHLFVHGQNDIEKLPLTRQVLTEHVRRAHFQTNTVAGSNFTAVFTISNR